VNNRHVTRRGLDLPDGSWQMQATPARRVGACHLPAGAFHAVQRTRQNQPRFDGR
jgi:hypothetical protein